jgi:hypothetical protein
VLPLSVKYWGYVFWDSERMTGRGQRMEKALRQAWWEEWHGADPREDPDMQVTVT